MELLRGFVFERMMSSSLEMIPGMVLVVDSVFSSCGHGKRGGYVFFEIEMEHGHGICRVLVPTPRISVVVFW